MNKAQWVLLTTFAASFYGVGNIWMTQFGWRLWPYVAPGDFGAYHNAWWAMIKPVIFPVAGVAFLGAFALIWWRPAGVTAAPVWLNAALQMLALRSHGDLLGPLAGADAFRKIAGWRARSDVPTFDEHTLDSCGADYAKRISCLLDGGSGSFKEPAKGSVATK